jgi:hypothetical protein
MAQRADREPGLERHPVREALLELIRRDGVVTATAAARELGGSTGLYSFHLRQLARFGIIEEAPSPGGRVRPWRLARSGAAPSPDQATYRPVSDAELSEVARGLEDESYRRWLEQRDTAPAPWRRDEAFSQVVYLTPDEMAGMAEVIRALLAQYRHREVRPAARPPEAAPVAVVARLFPLLEPGGASRQLGRDAPLSCPAHPVTARAAHEIRPPRQPAAQLAALRTWAVARA